jgi:phenylpropionate dioxygenase-like ring-hydroxylating dioxygenase large terminal subunit
VASSFGLDRADFTGEEIWSGTRRPLEQATGLPPAAYTDGDFFALERERLFGRAWVAVASASEVAEPGRVAVRTVGDTSVLIVRGHDGVLRGFVNSCRHRGTELASEDCTVSRMIRCPYHRWGYGLDGSLLASPLFDEVPRPDFDPAGLSLLPVRVDTWGLQVFACLDEVTPSLDGWLGDLPARMAGYGFDDWVVQERCTFDVAANWKLITENFQEYYHLGWVHPELARVSRVRDHYRYQGPGLYCGQTTTPVSSDERDDWMVLPPAPGLDDSDSVSGRFVAVFPNLTMAVLPGHAFVIRLEPLSVGLTREHCSLLLPGSTPAERYGAAIAETLKFWIEINNEDIDICERSQRGLALGGAPPGPLSPRFEEPLHRFHNMVADCLTADSLAGGLRIPPGDGPDDFERYGCGRNPSPPAIEASGT